MEKNRMFRCPAQKLGKFSSTVSVKCYGIGWILERLGRLTEGKFHCCPSVVW